MTGATSFQSVLDKFRKDAYSERDKGHKFERLMQAYLQTDPQYSTLFKNVWLWNDFPFKNDFGGKDTGIDLVAWTTSGDYWAIQCKCFQEDAVIDKPAVDSFLSTSSRGFTDENLKSVEFAHRLWISTTNHWGPNAEEAIRNQQPPVSRIALWHLQEAPVDWTKLEKGLTGETSRKKKNTLKPHQLTAVNAAHEYYKKSERGKLIMACGTGKTFTALKIAEKETDGKGLILFLVPSIALLGQTLREWSTQADETINPICICSDAEVGRQKVKNEDSDGFSVVDLALPASTSIPDIVRQFNRLKSKKMPGMTVVFSTYQSIEVIAKAQAELQKSGKRKNGSDSVFDLIICDEAHRTTGVTLAEEDSSAFVKVHDNTFIKAKRRLYMTATPRLYNDDSKARAKEADAILCSMDDTAIYGEEIYRIGFGEAVQNDLLTDYKVLILTVQESDMPAAVQAMIADSQNEINSDDASKLIGCINAMSKRIIGDDGMIRNSDPEPMRSAVAFCQSIKISKKITKIFNESRDIYLQSLPAEVRENLVSVSADHVDGTMSAPVREQKLSWLKSSSEKTNECRILTNVWCLSEGVDVPSLDAVLFLSAKNSQVDVVQSVGRVMRKAPGKKYGYIIIPVLVPSGIEADKALDNNERYKVVWTVLNALRAHDDRFNAIINKIELNRRKPDQILVGQPEYGSNDGTDYGKVNDSTTEYALKPDVARQLTLKFEQLQGIVFARMVQKVGDRRYWEQWAKDVAQIAENHIFRIKNLIKKEGSHKEAFANFLAGLRKNINPSITQDDAIEMLSQHIITKPVFEALFEGYSFVKNNPISVSMQTMLDLLEAQAIEKETETLQKFYESVKARAAGIDNAEGKQRIIIELYDKFFKTAFPKMVERLGIVYTPVEIVDFIIHSVEDVLNKEFGRSISDENIQILDPFTGTGTFITRLIQSGLIKKKDLERKYTKEIHANEIVLLAYYIASINIENAFHEAAGDAAGYKPFEGICLTDTFQLGESDESEKLFSDMFPQNSSRVLAQRKAPLRVIIGNPPYSVGQKAANDNAQNQGYPKLDSKIAGTYAKQSTAGLNKALYDSYMKAFRWSTDRLDPNNGGVIAFVSNGAWIDGNSTDGFRKSLQKEFSSIYILNLRGNQRTSGELSRKEGGKVFGSGSRTPIAITLLIKKPKSGNESAVIYYHDIGDYKTREEKLDLITRFHSISKIGIPFQLLRSNAQGDWLNHRKDIFDTFIPIAPENKFEISSKSYFIVQGPGVLSCRDTWVYNFSLNEVFQNIQKMCAYYNSQIKEYRKELELDSKISIDNIIDNDPTKISWSVNLKRYLEKQIKLTTSKDKILIGSYRPFCKQNFYFDNNFIERPGLNRKFFPLPTLENRAILVSGVGSNKEFSTLITDAISSYDTVEKAQCLPLYYFEEEQKETQTLFDEDDSVSSDGYIRRDGVSDFILGQARGAYGNKVSKEDIFYYVYGVLHSPDYRTLFASDLKKMLPRIPLVDEAKDFWLFSKAGRKLAELHINYENVAPAEGVIVTGAESGNFRVEKMRYPSKGEKGTILFNSHITVQNIPEVAYEYVVNGKSAIEWIMERYQVTVNKDSGIRNDPNDWAPENPRYILDLLLSVIRVSVETVEIVKGLPRMEFE
jgi:predicted helicase